MERIKTHSDDNDHTQTELCYADDVYKLEDVAEQMLDALKLLCDKDELTDEDWQRAREAIAAAEELSYDE